jgi:hypothetical protein
MLNSGTPERDGLGPPLACGFQLPIGSRWLCFTPRSPPDRRVACGLVLTAPSGWTAVSSGTGLVQSSSLGPSGPCSGASGHEGASRSQDAEQQQQEDDGNRDSDQPKQSTLEHRRSPWSVGMEINGPAPFRFGRRAASGRRSRCWTTPGRVRTGASSRHKRSGPSRTTGTAIPSVLRAAPGRAAWLPAAALARQPCWVRAVAPALAGVAASRRSHPAGAGERGGWRRARQQQPAVASLPLTRMAGKELERGRKGLPGGSDQRAGQAVRRPASSRPRGDARLAARASTRARQPLPPGLPGAGSPPDASGPGSSATIRIRCSKRR